VEKWKPSVSGLSTGQVSTSLSGFFLATLFVFAFAQNGKWSTWLVRLIKKSPSVCTTLWARIQLVSLLRIRRLGSADTFTPEYV
jgi:hypothetical protein